MKKFTAHFTPEAWIRDEAVEVDAEGPQEWDCTAFASRPENLAYLAEMRKWFGEVNGSVLDASDVFQEDPAAPQWVRNWHGPFDIRIKEEEGKA